VKTKLVKRHYCDHCKKGGQSKYCMARHERTCVWNPQRACVFCSKPETTVAELIEALNDGLPALEQKAAMCPACMLAAIVQSRKSINEDTWVAGFDYKKQASAWNAENEGREINVLGEPFCF